MPLSTTSKLLNSSSNPPNLNPYLPVDRQLVDDDGPRVEIQPDNLENENGK